MFEDGTWVVWLVIMGLYIGDWMNSKIIMGISIAIMLCALIDVSVNPNSILKNHAQNTKSIQIMESTPQFVNPVIKLAIESEMISSQKTINIMEYNQKTLMIINVANSLMNTDLKLKQLVRKSVEHDIDCSVINAQICLEINKQAAQSEKLLTKDSHELLFGNSKNVAPWLQRAIQNKKINDNNKAIL